MTDEQLKNLITQVLNDPNLQPWELLLNRKGEKMNLGPTGETNEPKRRYFKHKIMGHVKELHDLDLAQFVAMEFWEEISEEQYLQERVRPMPDLRDEIKTWPLHEFSEPDSYGKIANPATPDQLKTWAEKAQYVSPAPTTVKDFGPDFQIVQLQQAITISIARLFDVEFSIGTSPRAFDIAHIFGIRSQDQLKACTKIVMIVAKAGDARDDWAAYTAPMRTIMQMNTEDWRESEFIRSTIQYGDKLQQKTAEALFPIFVQLGFEYRH